MKESGEQFFFGDTQAMWLSKIQIHTREYPKPYVLTTWGSSSLIENVPLYGSLFSIKEHLIRVIEALKNAVMSAKEINSRKALKLELRRHNAG